MHSFMKPLAVAGLAGAMAVGAMSVSEARSRGAAVGLGFVAGAVVGAAAANAYNRPYNDGYAYAPGPAYYDNAPGYSYDQGYSAYGYDQGYAAPSRRMMNRSNNLRANQGAGGTGISDY